MACEEIGFAVIHPHPAVEGRPLRLEAGVLRPAEDIQMVPADPGPGLFFTAIADAEGHLLVLAFGDRDAHGHLRRLLFPFLLPFDVDELEELEAVQLALALAHFLAGEELARLERQ